MATLLRTNNTKELLQVKGEYLTLSEVSMLVNGLVKPVFVGEFWFFMCENGESLRRPINKQATEILGITVYGDVVIAEDKELSPSFYFPKEMVEAIKQKGQEIAKQYIDDHPEVVSEEESKKVIYEQLYKHLIESGRTMLEIVKNFVVFVDKPSNQMLIAEPNLDKRLSLIDKTIEYFTGEEDYEKCAELSDFRKKLIDFYKEGVM